MSVSGSMILTGFLRNGIIAATKRKYREKSLFSLFAPEHPSVHSALFARLLGLASETAHNRRSALQLTFPLICNVLVKMFQFIQRAFIGNEEHRKTMKRHHRVGANMTVGRQEGGKRRSKGGEEKGK